MPINELRAIATFAKAVELGSIRGAAAAQGVTPQAASKALVQLEEHLGVRLLNRTTRSLSLTDEGRRFLETTQPALAALERALTSARESKDEIAGPLRIAGPRSFAPVLMPVLDEFCSVYPDVQPEVDLDDELSNWVQDRVDVGFRIGVSPEEGLIARRLLPVQLIVCAAPRYLERHGMPRTLDDLTLHRCSTFRHPATRQVLPWYFDIGGEVVHHHVAPALSTNDTELELHALLAGQVIAQVSNLMAASYIRDGKLVPLLIQHMAAHFSLYLYYGSRTAQPARVRAFIELAIRHLADQSGCVMTPKELALAEARARKALRHA
jgi:DNA-binding transcriptional LysR family regulator